MACNFLDNDAVVFNDGFNSRLPDGMDVVDKFVVTVNLGSAGLFRRRHCHGGSKQFLSVSSSASVMIPAERSSPS